MGLVTKGLVALAIVGAPACTKYQSQPIPVRPDAVTAGVIPPNDAQRVGSSLPPYYKWRKEAPIHGLQRYGVGPRAPGSVPRQGTQPGTTRAVGPSQGTIAGGSGQW